MNRSFFNVILGGFGSDGGSSETDNSSKTFKAGSAEDAGFLLSNANSVLLFLDMVLQLPERNML